VLRGAAAAELTTLKRALLFLLYCGHAIYLEAALGTDQFATHPAVAMAEAVRVPSSPTGAAITTNLRGVVAPTFQELPPILRDAEAIARLPEAHAQRIAQYKRALLSTSSSVQLPLPFLVNRSLWALAAGAAAPVPDRARPEEEDGTMAAITVELVPVAHHPLEGALGTTPQASLGRPADDGDGTAADVDGGSAYVGMTGVLAPSARSGATTPAPLAPVSARTAVDDVVLATRAALPAVSAGGGRKGRGAGRSAVPPPTLWTVDLDPAAHQRLVILFSVFCEGLSAPCRFPQSLAIDYYAATDMTLGQYLEELVRNTRAACSACERSVGRSRDGTLCRAGVGQKVHLTRQLGVARLCTQDDAGAPADVRACGRPPGGDHAGAAVSGARSA
jgi:hypothetical protein